MDITASLTRKLGPLPVWVYGAIIAAAYWGWYLYSRREFSGTDATGLGGDDSGTDAGSWDEFFGDTDLTNSGGAVGSGTGGSAVVPGTTQPADNQTWFRYSADYLVGFGYEGVNVGNALTKYLTGEKLTVGERALVSLAIGRWGVPPEGVPVSTAPPPVDPDRPDPRPPIPPSIPGKRNPPDREYEDNTSKTRTPLIRR